MVTHIGLLRLPTNQNAFGSYSDFSVLAGCVHPDCVQFPSERFMKAFLSRSAMHRHRRRVRPSVCHTLVLTQN